MVQLDRESSLLTTFNTPWGKYRWLRLHFGLSISSDIFHERLHAIFRTVSGFTDIAVDVPAKGNNEMSHHVVVLTLLGTTRSNNLQFNLEKIQFKTKECKFFRQELATEGMRIDEKKVQAI